MGVRRINPLALLLGIVAVLGIGSIMITATDPWPQMEVKESTAQLRTMDVEFAPAPAMMPPPAIPTPPLEHQPRVTNAPAGPDVSPTAAPGVAFSYRYAFRLPGDRIAAVQEQHARACERLGVARCRITGMRFHVAEAAGGIQAMLALKLEPGLARRFGRAGTEAVASAGGELVDAEISGDDAIAPIRAADRGIAEMREDLQQLERRLAGRLSAEERTRLDYEARQLRQWIRGAEANRDEHQESLASTPMVFQYASGAPAPVAGRPDVGRGIARAGRTFLDGVSILAIIAATLLPWLLLGGSLWWLFRILRRRMGWNFRAAAAPAAA